MPRAGRHELEGVLNGSTPPTFSRSTQDHGHKTVPGKLVKPGYFIQAEDEHDELEEGVPECFFDVLEHEGGKPMRGGAVFAETQLAQ